MLNRERSGHEARPSAGAIDSQSIKAPCVQTRGYGVGEKVVNRKRHIAAGTDRCLLMVNLTSADGAYDRLQLMDKAAYLDFVV